MLSSAWCGGMGFAGWLVMLLFWASFLALAAWAITSLFPRQGGRHTISPAREELDRRLIEGEIDSVAYRQLLDELERPSRLDQPSSAH